MRTSRRVLLAAIGIGLSAGLALGSFGVAVAGDSALSAKQWRRATNAICKAASEQLAAAADQAFGQNEPDGGPSLAQITEYAELSEPIVEQQIADIEALAEPRKLRRKVAKLLSLAQAELERFVADPSVGLETDPFTDTALQAQRLRLKTC